MSISWRTEIPCWIMIAAMILLAATAWPWAPDRIPIHWGIQGEPDDFAGKAVGLFMPPGIALGVYLLFFLLPLLDPKGANYAKFKGTYEALKVALMAIFAALDGVAQLWIRGRPDLGSAALPLCLGVLFIVIGNFLGKIRPNWFIGIRTPWTLSSPTVWTKTHRRAGWAFVIAGLLVILADIFFPRWVYDVLAVAVCAACVYAVGYSFVAWRAEKRGGRNKADA